MATRLEVQKKLEDILGSRNVYFQPPEGFKLSYPCVVYILGRPKLTRADDKIYKLDPHYEITYIYKDPDDETVYTILNSFTHCIMDRTFISDNLYHAVYTLYE